MMLTGWKFIHGCGDKKFVYYVYLHDVHSAFVVVLEVLVGQQTYCQVLL